MWNLRRIFGKDASLAVRLIGAVAVACLMVGTYNVLMDGLPTLPLLIYRGAVILLGLSLFFLASHLGQRPK